MIREVLSTRILPLCLLCIGLLAVAGCRSGPDVTADINDQGTMQAVVVQHAPPGTSVEEALEFMQDEGFSCEMVINGIRLESDPRVQPVLLSRDYVGAVSLSPETRAMLFGTCRVREGVTFVRCLRGEDRTETSLAESATAPLWTWTVDLVVEDDKVVEVVCQNGWAKRF